MTVNRLYVVLLAILFVILTGCEPIAVRDDTLTPVSSLRSTPSTDENSDASTPITQTSATVQSVADDTPTEDVKQGPVETPTASDIIVPPTVLPVASTPNLPTVTPTDTSATTPTPVPVTIIVPGDKDAGVNVLIDSSGIYRVEYVGNAYSPWPSNDYDGNQGWATHIQVFINRPVEWGIAPSGFNGPINFDAYLGADGYYLEQNDAVAATLEKYAPLGHLGSGSYITFIVVDEPGQYSDNRGEVELVLRWVGP